MNYQATCTLELDLPREDAWTCLRDLRLAHRYVPGLTDCKLRTAQREGVSASRRVYRKGNRYLDETVMEWRDGEGFLIRLHQGDEGAPAPFRNAWFRYALSDGDRGSRITTSLIFDLRGGLAGKLLYKLLLRRALDKTVAQITANLKTFYETGKTTNPLLADS